MLAASLSHHSVVGSRLLMNSWHFGKTFISPSAAAVDLTNGSGICGLERAKHGEATRKIKFRLQN